MRHALAVLTLLALAGTASAQPDPAAVSPSAPSKQIPSIPDTLAMLRQAYREGPVADRVVMRATSADGKERRVQVVVYTDHGQKESAGTNGQSAVKARPAQLRVDLSQLHVHISAGTLTALNLFDRTTYFRTDCGNAIDEALAQNFPPVPLPQIPAAFAEDTTIPAPTPLTPGVTWTAIEAATDVGRSLLALKGSSRDADVTLMIDRTTGRVRKLIAEFRGAQGASLAKLDLTCSAADSGESRNWLLPVDGRTRVESPALLAPPRSGLAPGGSIKHVSLMTEQLAPLAPDALFAEDAALTVLVTVRSEGFGAGTRKDDLDAALNAAHAAMKDARDVRAVVLLGKDELDPVKLESMVKALRELRADAGVDAGAEAGPLVTASEVLTVERGGQPADVAILVVARDLSVRGVVVADGRGNETAKMRDELTAAMQAPAPKVEAKPDTNEKPGVPSGTPGAK